VALPTFLIALFEHSRAPVDALASRPTSEELRAAGDVLSQVESVHRAHFPGAAPIWNAHAGLWAARQFYVAAQLVVQRAALVETWTADLTAPCPAPISASTCYSVDLVFQFLPDLHRLARRDAQDDPLLAILNQWAEQWPLSSVGMHTSENISIDPLVVPELLAFYAERIISRNAVERLNDPRVGEEVRRQLGLHNQLSPVLWDALASD
jgi:hypothetical protein